MNLDLWLISVATWVAVLVLWRVSRRPSERYRIVELSPRRGIRIGGRVAMAILGGFWVVWLITTLQPGWFGISVPENERMQLVLMAMWIGAGGVFLWLLFLRTTVVATTEGVFLFFAFVAWKDVVVVAQRGIPLRFEITGRRPWWNMWMRRIDLNDNWWHITEEQVDELLRLERQARNERK